MIEQESKFLTSLNRILSEYQKAISDLINSCEGIAKEYSNAKNFLERDRFNLFHVISDLYYRENFHSDIIRFLLDPQANHGYNHLMLDCFIDMLNKIKVEGSNKEIKKTNYLDATVEREYETTDGRIDLLIKTQSNKRAIIIENKMNNAGDMPRQLPRYYDYLVKVEEYTLDAIVYLPLEYKYPDMDDWNEEDKIKISSPLLKIIPAYDNMHNTNLVEDCFLEALPKIDNLNVISTIRQYSDLIIQLNKNNMDSIILEKFYKELQQNPDNLKTAQSIRNMLNDMPAYLAQRIRNKFNGACDPFEKVWVHNSTDAVFEKAVIAGIYTKMDIWCNEDQYEVVFWSPTDDLAEEAFSELVDNIKSLKGFKPRENVKNQIVRHFDFNEEKSLFDFINNLKKDLLEMRAKSSTN